MKLLDNEPDAAGSEVAVEIKVWALVLALQFVIQVVSVVIFNDLVYLIITLVAVCYQIIMVRAVRSRAMHTGRSAPGLTAEQVGVVVYGAHSRRALPLLVVRWLRSPSSVHWLLCKEEFEERCACRLNTHTIGSISSCSLQSFRRLVRGWRWSSWTS